MQFREGLRNVVSAAIVVALSMSVGVDSAAEEKTVPGPMVRVEDVKGVPTFTVDGAPMTIPCFETYHPTEHFFGQFAQAGVNVFSFNTNAAACDYGHSKPTWLDVDTWDYGNFEERARHVLAAKPDALIIPRVNMGTPRWWLDQNPGELEVLDHGSTLYREPNTNPTLPGDRAFPSVVSEKWRADMGLALRRFIRHVQASEFGPHIFGYILAGLDTEEWYHWSSGSNQLAGYSKPTERAFRAWLRDKYSTDDTLQEAWNRPGVTLDTAVVPEREARWDREQGTLRDPAEKMDVIDFYLFYNEIVPETIEVFSDIIREETGGTKAIGAFYGYMYEFRGDPEYGHNALERFNEIDSLDFMFVTASYENRAFATGGDYSRSSAYSVRLHDKLWYHDNDVCSFLAPEVLKKRGMNEESDWSRSLLHHLKVLGYTETAEQTKWMYRRSLGFALASGAYESYFDLHGGYYDHPELMQEVEDLNEVADASKHADRRSNSEILVLADESSCAYTTFASRFLAQNMLNTQHRIIKVGAPADHVLLCDLPLLDTKPYKLVIMLNCYNISADMRQVIQEKLLRDGKHVVWCYAPGLFDGPNRSVKAMQEITGIRLIPAADNSYVVPSIAPIGRETVIERAAEPFNADLEASCSVISVQDQDAEALGVLPGTDTVVFARKDMGDWQSVYSITGCLPPALYRELARDAGVHIYNETDDTFYANRSYVVLHADGVGPRTIRLPRQAKATDVMTGKILCEDADAFTYTFENGETLIVQYE